MDMPRNSFKRAIATGRRQIGLWCNIPDSLSVELLSGAGFDWILIDTEHAPNELPTVVRHLQAAKGGTAHPVVRPAWNDTVLLKRLLDVGFYNFLVPFVQSEAEAKAAVAATRYPPAGVRGVSVSQRSNHYGTVEDYQKRINDEICIVVQIENRAGVEAAAAIAAVDGVDGLFVGPSDLAAALGHLGDPNHPEVQEAMRIVFAAAKAAGKSSGILAPVEADARRYLDAGVTFVAVGSDLGVFRAATKALKEKYL
jgi:2-dehydro-3-deoxyglucarate aldolase